MKKLLLLLSVIALLAAGCKPLVLRRLDQPSLPVVQQQQPSATSSTTENPKTTVPKVPAITVYQTVEGSNLNKPSYTVSEGEKEIGLLKASHAVEVKSYSFGDMVIGIDGVKPDSTHFWEFYVNGKSSNVGASDYVLKSGDKIEWKLSKINSSGQ